ncbi:MAG: O-antigen ligase family protein [Terriglobia bacterium]
MKTMGGAYQRPGERLATARSRHESGFRLGNLSAWWVLLPVGLLAAFTAFLFDALPDVALGWDALPLMGVGILLFAVLLVGLGSSRTRAASAWRIGLVLWWFLLCSQEFFARFTSQEATALGHYAPAAYEEAIFWILILVALSIATLGSPGYLGSIVSGRYGWLTLYVILCAASTVLSVNHLFSLAWAFKLGLVVLVIQLLSSQMHSYDDLRSLLRVTLWAFAFLAIVPTLQSFLNPAQAFGEGGRLGGLLAPDEQSALSGVLILLLLALYSESRLRWPVLLGGIGVATMVMSGGKTGIVAAMFSGTAFYLLQKKFRPAIGLLIGFVLVGLPLYLFTPFGGYLQRYMQSGEASTFTGRTPLWQVAISGIFQRPVLGHGFAASQFMANQLVDLPFAATNAHNGFLEALYNNGLVGLILILLILGYTARNLWKAAKEPSDLPGYPQLAAGLIAVFLDLLINGMVAGSFAGRVRADFVMLLGMVVISEVMVRFKAERARAGSLPSGLLNEPSNDWVETRP